MRNIKLNRTILLLSAIALGCISVTPDAFARGGVGGHAAPSAGAASSHAGFGHAAPSAGAASSHVGAAPRGISIGGVSHGHAFDGASAVHVGQGFGWD
jgi:hypothetical protein